MMRPPTMRLSLLLGLALFGCARSSPPLPGESVSADGAITLSPPRLSTSPYEVREAREGLGPIETRLFPPELVMEHQGALGVTPDQRQALVAETERGQAEMARLMWDLQRDKEKLVDVLDAEKIDEKAASDAAARVMEHETKVKASHLGMLVRVKNLLTAEQQSKLRRLREGARASGAADAKSVEDAAVPAPPSPPPSPSRRPTWVPPPSDSRPQDPGY